MTSRPRLPLRAAGRVATAVVLAAGLAACAADVNPRGNEPAAEVLSQIEPGTHTQAQVRSMLGSPSTTSTFGDETWYYISAKTTQWAYRSTQELDRQVVAISFAPNGVVKDIQTMDKSAGREVDIVDRETPTPGKDETILQQMLGNLGRFKKE
ncbi:Outer membrane lipoprotein OmlA [Caenispirillum salinarum AK4]|uniref:Outer membrane lipoprotein OmlA n=1 Tax=Caenispirillum salinarum AK4 TaxID=1238182 RepID=K9GZA4_9PROT|nr:outer membrane protein assembly factor BamE [Caenispirillum salinarum]EKV31310.1 Outer membrane lipoprotein OmlA [Caenispirillum salinarum AK4]